MPATEPIAVLGDTLTLVVALMAARYALVALRGEAGWWGWGAAWLRRISIVALLLLALRLVAIAAARPEIAAPVGGFVAMILLSGAVLVAGDHWLSRTIAARFGRP